MGSLPLKLSLASHARFLYDYLGLRRHGMKISYDSDIDALTIVFIEGAFKGKQLGDGIAAGYSPDGHLAAIQIQDAAARFGGLQTLHQIILEGMGG
jgi:uncharacterized protein YuzE